MHSLPEPAVGQFRADLHCHTVFSDGTATPEELIDHAVAAGLSALAITDHDTIGAYERAIPYAKQKKILLGTGVEFSSLYKKVNVHILGYDFSLSNQFLQEFCSIERHNRKDRNRRILERLKRLRMLIEEEELDAMEKFHSTIGRPHIAQLMLQKGYVKSIQEAFSLYLGDQKCCYEQGKSVSIEEVVSVLREAGGKVFLAHPHQFNDGGLVRDILLHGFDGIECYYSKCAPEKEKRWLKMAKAKNLLVSGGSDFHGTVKPHIPLGCSWVTHGVFEQIFQNNLFS